MPCRGLRPENLLPQLSGVCLIVLTMTVGQCQKVLCWPENLLPKPSWRLFDNGSWAMSKRDQSTV
jgi:hypothetical protein